MGLSQNKCDRNDEYIKIGQIVWKKSEKKRGSLAPQRLSAFFCVVSQLIPQTGCYNRVCNVITSVTYSLFSVTSGVIKSRKPIAARLRRLTTGLFSRY